MDAGQFAKARLGFEPDAQQLAVLRSSAKRGILNCSRQWGKSTVAAAKAVHRAYTRADCLVVVASRSQRQSVGIRAESGGDADQTRDHAARGWGQRRRRCCCRTGRGLWGCRGLEATVRGFSAVSLLMIDEASRVKDAMYTALRPMLAVADGDLWLMSTPNGKQGFFYEAWEHGGPNGCG